MSLWYNRNYLKLWAVYFTTKGSEKKECTAQTDHLISAIRPDLVIADTKREPAELDQKKVKQEIDIWKLQAN